MSGVHCGTLQPAYGPSEQAAHLAAGRGRGHRLVAVVAAGLGREHGAGGRAVVVIQGRRSLAGRLLAGSRAGRAVLGWRSCVPRRVLLVLDLGRLAEAPQTLGGRLRDLLARRGRRPE